MNAIELSNVNYSSDQFNLKNISFKVPQGFVTGFIGRNGAGKTTIIRLIMDLYQPQTGVIRVLEEDMALNPIELKNKLGLFTLKIILMRDGLRSNLKNDCLFIVTGIIKYFSFILKSSIYQSINQ